MKLTRSLLVTAAALIGIGAAFSVAAPEAPASSATMKAVRIHDYGDPSVLTYEDAPKPTAAAGEVLIHVRAAGVNPVDWKIRSGAFKQGLPLTMPAILGYDVSGVIEAVGDGVTNFKPGDEVYSYLPIARGGGYAQYVAAPASGVCLKPKSLDHRAAAGVPLAALTAWQALFDTAGLKPGQIVLIHAGSGGVGHFAIQLAKAKGAHVIATASDKNQTFIKKLGVDVAIDYKAQKFEEVARNVDVVLDAVGGDTLARSYGCLKPGGFIVSIVAPPDPAKLKEFSIRGAVMMVKPNAAQLAEIGALIDHEAVIPHIGQVFALKDAAKAHEASQTGRTVGKIVLTVD